MSYIVIYVLYCNYLGDMNTTYLFTYGATSPYERYEY